MWTKQNYNFIQNYELTNEKMCGLIKCEIC